MRYAFAALLLSGCTFLGFGSDALPTKSADSASPAPSQAEAAPEDAHPPGSSKLQAAAVTAGLGLLVALATVMQRKLNKETQRENPEPT